MPRNRQKQKSAKRKPTQLELPGTQAAPAFHSTTLPPCYLVGLSTSVKGNAKYYKEIIEAEHRERSTGAAKMRWTTERVIANPEEHKKANQVRMKARQIIHSVCNHSELGLFCPESRAEKLDLAFAEANRIVDRFNRTATLTRVVVNIAKGHIAQDDVQAVRAIRSEVRGLMQEMTVGVKSLDVKKIREAAVKARSVGGMLSPTAAASVKSAIEAARGAATKIAKKIKDAGEAAAIEIDREAIRAIAEARTAFLDTDDPTGTEAVTLEGDTREVDIDPDAPEAPEEAEAAPETAPEEPVGRLRKRSRGAGARVAPGKGKAASRAPRRPGKRVEAEASA